MNSQDAMKLVEKLQGKWSSYLKLEYSVEFPGSVLSNAQTEALQDIICKGLEIELYPVEQKRGQVIAGRLPGRNFILRRKAREDQGVVYHAPFLSTSTVRRLFQKAYGKYSGAFYGQNNQIFHWLLKHPDLSYLIMLTRPIPKGSQRSEAEKARIRSLIAEAEQCTDTFLRILRELERVKL